MLACGQAVGCGVCDTPERSSGVAPGGPVCLMMASCLCVYAVNPTRCNTHGHRLTRAVPHTINNNNCQHTQHPPTRNVSTHPYASRTHALVLGTAGAPAPYVAGGPPTGGGGASLAFTRYSFTSTLLWTSHLSLYRPSHLERLHCYNSIARLLRKVRPSPDPPYVCYAAYNIDNNNIV